MDFERDINLMTDQDMIAEYMQAKLDHMNAANLAAKTAAANAENDAELAEVLAEIRRGING